MMKSVGLKSQRSLLADRSTGLADESDARWDSPRQTADQFEAPSDSHGPTARTGLPPSSGQMTNALPGFWTLPYAYPRVSTGERPPDEATDRNSWAMPEFHPPGGRPTAAQPGQEPYGKMQEEKHGVESYRRKDDGSLPTASTSKLNFPTGNNPSNVWPESRPTTTPNYQTGHDWASNSAAGNAPQISSRATKSYTELTNKQPTNAPGAEPARILNLDNQKETYSCDSNQQRGQFGPKFQQLAPSDSPTWHTPQTPQLYSCFEQKHDSNFFRATSSANKKPPCCFGAHRPYAEFHDSQKSQPRSGGDAPGTSAGTSKDVVKQKYPWFSDVSHGRSAKADTGSQEPQTFGLRTYEADSTSTQLSDSCSTPGQKFADRNLARPDGEYQYEQSKSREPNSLERFVANQGTDISTNISARYGYVRKPYDIAKYPYRGSAAQPSPASQERVPSDLKRTFQDLPPIPCDSQGCPGPAPTPRHPWLSADRLPAPWISDAALEEKRRRNREASARCEEKRKWKTEQLKKDNEFVRLASVKLFEENQLLWERLERLRSRHSSGCGQRPSETEIN